AVPEARVAARLVLNALTTRDCGSDAAICAAAELSAGTVSESKGWKFSGLGMSTTTLPASWSPRVERLAGVAAWGTASTTMAPVTGLPVSEWRSSSTVLPPLLTRPEMAWPMLPLPMIVTCVMEMLPSGEVSCCYNLAPVPSVEERVVAGDPGPAEPGRAQVPVRADLGRARAQVLPQVVEGRAAPEPVAVIHAVHVQSRRGHEGVCVQRGVLGVGGSGDVWGDVGDPAGVGKGGPLGAGRVAEVLRGVVVVGGGGDALGVGRRVLGVGGGQFQVLVVF